MGAEEPWKENLALPHKGAENGSRHDGLSGVPYRDKKRSALR